MPSWNDLRPLVGHLIDAFCQPIDPESPLGRRQIEPLGRVAPLALLAPRPHYVPFYHLPSGVCDASEPTQMTDG